MDGLREWRFAVTNDKDVAIDQLLIKNYDVIFVVNNDKSLAIYCTHDKLMTVRDLDFLSISKFRDPNYLIVYMKDSSPEEIVSKLGFEATIEKI